jgi:hypothetical protein
MKMSLEEADALGRDWLARKEDDRERACEEFADIIKQMAVTIDRIKDGKHESRGSRRTGEGMAGEQGGAGGL